MGKGPLKVCVISRGIYPSQIGGAEIHAYFVARRLATKCDVRLISESQDGKRRVSPYCSLRLSGHSQVDTVLFASYIFVYLLLFAKRYSVIQIHQAYSGLVGAVMASAFNKTPIVVTCHGSDVTKDLSNPLWALLQRVALKRSRIVVAVSNDVARTIIRRFGRPRYLRVIRNGFDERVIPSLKLLRHMSGETVSLVYVGRLSPPKDPITAIRAVQMLPAAKYKGYIVGDGSMRKELEAYCNYHSLSKRIFFLGLLSHQQALRVVSDSDIMVLTSRSEGFPTSLIEALSLGKPCVATDVGGVSEVIEDGMNGFMVAAGDAEGVRNAVLKLSSGPRAYDAYSVRAAGSVAGLSWREIANQYENMYETLRVG